jgi:hypothetical protein
MHARRRGKKTPRILFVVKDTPLVVNLLSPRAGEEGSNEQPGGHRTGAIMHLFSIR